MSSYKLPVQVIKKDVMDHDKREFLRCRKCAQPFHYKLPRNWFGQNLLFFIPVKRYFCAKCLKARYRVMTAQKERLYKV